MIRPIQLGQAALTASYATIYTTPVNASTYLKDMDVCNTGSAMVSLYVSIVPQANSADATNALFFNVPIPGGSTLQWTGTQLMPPGSTLQARGSTSGLTITASGGEAS
jgi:hypothetical protein